MSECAHASIIVPFLLQCWLKPYHVRRFYKKELQAVFPAGQLFDHFSNIDLIVFCFGQLAKSNSIVSSFELSIEDCRMFNAHIMHACVCFLGLMNAASDLRPPKKRKSKGKEKNKQATLSNNTMSPITSCFGSISDLLASIVFKDNVNQELEVGLNCFLIDNDDKAAAKAKQKIDKLPNFHIGIYFIQLMDEIAHIWNANVLWGEDKHQFFKAAVLATNHQKPELQLLTKEVILFTIKSAMNRSFLQNNLELTIQFTQLRVTCPKLLESLVPSMEHSTNHNIASCLAGTDFHLQPAVRGKLKQLYLAYS